MSLNTSIIVAADGYVRIAFIAVSSWSHLAIDTASGYLTPAMFRFFSAEVDITGCEVNWSAGLFSLRRLLAKRTAAFTLVGFFSGVFPFFSSRHLLKKSFRVGGQN